MKELLEEYVMEKLQLQQQAEILVAIVSFLSEGATTEIDLADLQNLEPMNVRVEGEKVYIG